MLRLQYCSLDTTYNWVHNTNRQQSRIKIVIIKSFCYGIITKLYRLKYEIDEPKIRLSVQLFVFSQTKALTQKESVKRDKIPAHKTGRRSCNSAARAHARTPVVVVAGCNVRCRFFACSLCACVVRIYLIFT